MMMTSIIIDGLKTIDVSSEYLSTVAALGAFDPRDTLLSCVWERPAPHGSGRSLRHHGFSIILLIPLSRQLTG